MRKYIDRKNYIIPVVRDKDDVELETIYFDTTEDSKMAEMEQLGRELAYFVYNYTPSIFYSGLMEGFKKFQSNSFEGLPRTRKKRNVQLGIKSRKMVLE